MKNRFRASLVAAALLLAAFTTPLVPAADWPMWRVDANRTASSAEALAEKLHLQWTRDLPPLKPAFWQVRQERVQFDLGYEPVVMGKILFVGSSLNDSVIALDTDTGAERWRFYTDGPVRLAPVALRGRLYFGSDDGFLYCLDAISGKLQWKVRGAPSNRKVLGNGRLISVWPVRGGPVAADDRVYFAAGVWPFEGIFVWALDARTARTLWVNDRTGSLYLVHPHGAMSFGGPSPQGYLLINRGRLVVPSSRAFPAFFDLATGKLLSFDFGHGRQDSQTGGWFVASDADGGLCVDPEISAEMHDGGLQTVGQIGFRRQDGDALRQTVTIGKESYRVREGAAGAIRVGDREYRFADGFPGVEGRIHTMLAASDRLFVVTRAGKLYCFGAKAVAPKNHPVETEPSSRPSDAWAAKAKTILTLTGHDEGYALLFGLGTGRLAEELALQSKLHLVVVESDARKVNAFRRRLDAAGLHGRRIVAHAGNPIEFGLPPYLANLIVCEDGGAVGEKLVEAAFAALRPYGGVLWLQTPAAEQERISAWLKRPAFAGAHLRREGEWSLIVRAGPLPGAADYNGRANYDHLVIAPLGLLWFGDTAHHHKLFYQGYEHEAGRGLPQYIRVVSGVMSYLVPTEPVGQKLPSMSYKDFLGHVNGKTYVEARTDIYTGRTLPSSETNRSSTVAEPTETFPPLTRKNPVTGVEEAREFMKTYGCDQRGADYGNMITMRSGTAAFYDKRAESGTINVSGTRSGCRNSMVVAGGLLNMPAWTGNCTCNYPVFTSLALMPMLSQFEQWTAWGGAAVDAPIQRVGINFGAPGDRMTDDGTLWLDWPSVGGPSLDVRVRVTPETVESFYRHSLWMKGGSGWPWVFASGIKGVRTIQIETIARATNAPSERFSVRWTGQIEPKFSEEYAFHTRSDGPMHVWIGNRPLLDSTLKPFRDGQRDAWAKIALNASTKYDLLVDYKHAPAAKPAPPAFAELSWSSPSLLKTVIPSERLLSPDGRRGGLAGVYYNTERLTGPALFQRDVQVRFEWDSKLPPILKRRPPVQPVERAYTVRLVFAEPEALRIGERVFSVKLQGNEVLNNFDIVKEAGGPNHGVVREFHGIRARESLNVEFLPSTEKPPVICGIELIAE